MTRSGSRGRASARQLAGRVGGAAADLEAAGQDALAATCRASTQACMTRQISQQARADLGLGAPGLLVLQHQRGDRQAGLLREPQQLVAGAEGVRQDGVVELDPVRADRVLVDDEAAADRVVRLLQQRRARRRRSAQSVMPLAWYGRALAAVQDQVARRSRRRSRARRAGAAAPVARIALDPLVGASRRRPCAGELALQAEQDGLRRCRGRGRSRRASRRARRVPRRVRASRPSFSQPAGEHARPRASGRPCGSWTGRCRSRTGRRPRWPRGTPHTGWYGRACWRVEPRHRYECARTPRRSAELLVQTGVQRVLVGQRRDPGLQRRRRRRTASAPRR